MPLIVKAKFKKGRDKDLRDFIAQELADVIGNRAGLERRWEDHIVAWRSQLPEGNKDFPFPGASNLVFPLTPIHADPIVADFVQTLTAPPDYWSITATRSDRVAHATPVQRLLTSVERDFIKMRRVIERAVLDQVVLGTSVYKNHWDTHRASVLERDGSKSLRIISRPAISHVPLQHFYIPPDAWSIDPDSPGGAKWCGEKFYLTKEQMEARVADDARGYDKSKVDSILRWEAAQRDRVDDLERALDTQPLPHFYKIELFELHVRFDIDGDDVPEDLVLIWHQGIQDFVRAIHEPHLHGARPYHDVGYLLGFGFYRIGLSETDEWAQLTLTKLLNAIIDNTLIGNTIMIAGPQGAMIGPNEPVYPGRYFPLGPNETIQGIKLGEVNPNLSMLIGQFLQFSELRTGQSELRGGNISSLPSRTPATTILEMLRMGNKRFDMILSNLRDVHSEMGLRLLQNIAQEYQDTAEVMRWQRYCVQSLGEADAQKVIEVLGSESAEIAASMGVSVTATNALVNKEASKQALVGMMQVIMPMYQQLVQGAALLPQLGQPGSPAYEAATASFVAGIQLIARLLEAFDIQNPNEYLGNLQAIAGALTAQQQGMNPAMAGALAPQMGPYPQQSAPAGVFGPAQLGSLFGLG